MKENFGEKVITWCQMQYSVIYTSKQARECSFTCTLSKLVLRDRFVELRFEEVMKQIYNHFILSLSKDQMKMESSINSSNRWTSSPVDLSLNTNNSMSCHSGKYYHNNNILAAFHSQNRYMNLNRRNFLHQFIVSLNRYYCGTNECFFTNIQSFGSIFKFRQSSCRSFQQ